MTNPKHHKLKNVLGASIKLSNGETIYDNAVSLHLQGDVYSAEIEYHKAIQAGYGSERLFSNLGTIYQSWGRYQEAVDLYQRSIQINPDYAPAHMNLGVVYKEIGNLDKAITSILRSMDLNPNNYKAFCNLGIIYKALGCLDKLFLQRCHHLGLKLIILMHMNLGII